MSKEESLIKENERLKRRIKLLEKRLQKTTVEVEELSEEIEVIEAKKKPAKKKAKHHTNDECPSCGSMLTDEELPFGGKILQLCSNKKCFFKRVI